MNRDKVWTPIFLALLMLLSTTATPLLSEILQSEEDSESEVLEPEWEPRSTVAGDASSVMFSEVLFDPLGDDLGEETLAIRNIVTDLVNLSGWQIVDEYKNTVYRFNEGYSLDPFSTVYVHLYPGLNSWPESGLTGINQVHPNSFDGWIKLDIDESQGLLPNAVGSLGLYAGDPFDTEIVDYVRWGGEARSMSGTTLDAYSAELWHPSEFVDTSGSGEGQAIGTTYRNMKGGASNWRAHSADDCAVVINEVLLMTDEVYENQWIELYNPGPGTQQIEHWQLVNTGSRYPLHIFESGLTIPARESIVIELADESDERMIGPMTPVSSFVEHFIRATNAGANPLNISSDQLMLLKPVYMSGGVQTEGLVDYVEWGESTNTELRDYAVAEGHWSDDQIINTAGMQSPDSIGRDRDSTDTNSPNDWDIDGGEDANSPTRRYMNSYNVHLESVEWSSQGKIAKIVNFGSSLNVSGWNFANIVLRDSIPIPTGTVIPENAVLEVHFDNGSDDLDFSDGIGEIHIGTPLEVNDVGFDIVFLRSSTDGLADLMGMLVFVDGVAFIENSSDGLGRWGFSCSLCSAFVDGVKSAFSSFTGGLTQFLADTLSGLVGAVEWTIEQVNEAFDSFQEWLKKIGMAMIEEALSWLKKGAKKLADMSGLTELLDIGIHYPSDTDMPDGFNHELGVEPQYTIPGIPNELQWLVSIESNFHWGPPDIGEIELFGLDTGIEYKAGFVGNGLIQVGEYCGGDIQAHGSIGYDMVFDFELDYYYVGIGLEASLNSELEFSLGSDMTSTEGGYKAEITISFDFDYNATGYIAGLGSGYFDGTFNIFTHTWEFDVDLTRSTDTCDGHWDNVNLIQNILSSPGLIDWGDHWKMLYASVSHNSDLYDLIRAGFDFNLSLIISYVEGIEELNLEIFDEKGWLNSSHLHSPTDTGDGLQSQLEIEFNVPTIGSLSLTENMIYERWRQRCSCIGTGILLELDVVNIGPVLTNRVTTIVSNSSDSSQSDTAILDVPVYERYRVMASSSNGWPVEVVSGTEHTGFNQDELRSLMFRVQPPLGTPGGIMDTVTVNMSSLSNASNKFSVEIDAATPYHQAQTLFYDSVRYSSASQVDAWTVTGDWEHGSPRSGPTNSVGYDIWSSNPDGIAQSDYSILKSPIMDLSGHDQVVLSFEEWYNTPNLPGFKRTLVTAHDLTTGEAWVLGPRTWSSSAGNWLNTSYQLMEEMLSEQVQFQFHYRSPTGIVNDGFWAISNVRVRSCVLPEWDVATDIGLQDNVVVVPDFGTDFLISLNNPSSQTIHDLDLEWTMERTDFTDLVRDGFDSSQHQWFGAVTYSDDYGVQGVRNALRDAPVEGDGADDAALRAQALSGMNGGVLVLDRNSLGSDDDSHWLQSPIYDLDEYDASDLAKIGFRLGLSEGMRLDNIAFSITLDAGGSWNRITPHVGAGNEWVGYDSVGWIRWLDVDLGSYENITSFGLKLESDGPGIIALDDLTVVQHTTSVAGFGEYSFDISPGGARTFAQQVNMTAGQDGPARYDLTIRQHTVAQDYTMTTSHLRSPPRIVSLAGSLSESSWLNQDLPISVTTSSGGLVDYYLSRDNQAPIFIGSSIDGRDILANVDAFDGDYTLIAVYTDPWGHQAVDSVQLSIEHDSAPVADFDFELAQIEIGDSLNVSAAGSSDDSGIVRYEWRIEGPENHTFDTPEINLELQNEGTYNLILTVYDVNDQSSTTETTFDVFRSFEGQDEPDDGTSDESISTDDGDSDRSSSVAGISKDSMIALLLVVIVILLGMFASQSKREDDE